MKKLTTAFAAMMLCVSAFASGTEPKNSLNEDAEKAVVISTENVSKVVAKAFSSKYANAADVNWKAHPAFYFASFKLSEQKYTATFATNGELIAVSREISSAELPLAVTSALASNYSNYTIAATASEMVMYGETHYYIVADGKTKLLHLKCAPDGSISTFKKIKKKVLVSKAY